MTEVNRFHIYLSSSLKQEGKIEDYTFTLSRPIILSNPHHYFKVVVKQATIPYTFQQINNNYNKFQYKIIRNSIDYGIRTFVIKNGNYTILSLITEVQTQLLTDLNIIIPGYIPIFNWTYDRDQMAVTFSFTPDLINTSFTIYNLDKQINTMLGVTQNITFFNVGSSITTATSNQPVNISPITSLFIRSASLKQQDLSRENLVNTDDISDILVQVPILNQPTSWITYLNDLNIENRIVNTIINDINIYLSDNLSFELNLRGIDWSCVITVIEVAPVENIDSFNTVRMDLRHNHQLMNDALQMSDFQIGIPVPKEENKKTQDPTFKIKVPEIPVKQIINSARDNSN
jgi:hypothetical protein